MSTMIVHNKRTIRTPVYVTDADGRPVLDENGKRIVRVGEDGKRKFLQGQPCKKCGTPFFYWGHDSSKPGTKWCSQDGCQCKGSKVNWTPLDGDKLPHKCGHTGTVPDLDPGDDLPDDDQDGELAALRHALSQPIPVTAPAVPAAPLNGTANGHSAAVATLPALAGNEAARKLAAFQELFSDLVPAQNVNADEVRVIVSDMVPSMIADAVVATVPTVVEAATKHLRPVVQLEIKRPDGVVHKIDGLSHSVLPKLLRVIATGKHVFLPGPAGTGKSHMARQAATALGKPFYAVSVGPTMLESKLLGYMDAKGEFISTVFYEWCKKGGIFLLDEVDNGNPSVLNVMNSALANKFVSFPNGEMVELCQDCICLAAGNTFGTGPDRAYVGRQALDAAFKNRFVFLEVPIDEALEEQLCLRTGLERSEVTAALELVRRLRKKIAELKLPIVMGPRNAEAYCALRNAGFTRAECSDMALRQGLSDADWRKISSDY